MSISSSTAASISTKKAKPFYHLLLLSDTQIQELWLSEISNGVYSFSTLPEYGFLRIKENNGSIFAVCDAPAFFQDVPFEQSCNIELTDGQMLRIDCAGSFYTLYCRFFYTKENMIFRNYSIAPNTWLSIGRRKESDIYFNNPYISLWHAVLSFSDGKWSIRDGDNTNGIYVNSSRVNECTLHTGDTLEILDLKIIIGVDCISIPADSSRVSVNTALLQELQPWKFSSYYHDIKTDFQYFNRSPRKPLERSNQAIALEAPPMSINQKQIPLMLRMGSSMIMGGAAAIAGNFLTLLSSTLFPFLTAKLTDKQRQEYEQLRYTKYTEYLEQKRQEIETACHDEYSYLNRKFPAISEILLSAKEMYHIWERRPLDDDFLLIRLGTGSQLLSNEIKYPERKFEIVIDDLEIKMYSLAEAQHLVENVPVLLSLTRINACALQGNREKILFYLMQLILQISVLHSCDEVKMVFITTPDTLSKLDSVRYLPHVWDDQKSIRFIATQESEAYYLGEYIKNQVSPDLSGNTSFKKIMHRRPFYIVFALDKKVFEAHTVFAEIMQAETPCAASVITAFDDLPKETQKLIILSDKSGLNGSYTSLDCANEPDQQFRIDNFDPKDFSIITSLLANIHIKAAERAQEIPKMVTFLEIYHVGRINLLNITKRWKENNPVKSLAVPVGIGSDGTTFMLDLHEKYQGPHGLVAGMTGSGKSEFLITYILSMAVNFSPDEVAFVLIDYKGGGLAGAFENTQSGIRLPHLVGTITNLDGSSIQRSLTSIESELIRRQKIFNLVKHSTNEGTMDIYAYQRLYRAGKAPEAMPHLFIIADEFAELKQQQTEFMTGLISAARIGRSLGIHLILATQKPSGIVDDQIRSNTKFRVCLRVQERSDSMDMLKRPDAAELTDTGRFYLQVGYNEFFALGQSAWCGAAYAPESTVASRNDDTVDFLDITGQIVTKAHPKIHRNESGQSQLIAVVQYLSSLSAAQGFKSRSLWQPELPKILPSEQLSLSPLPSMTMRIAIVDDPENQNQFPLDIDFESCPNILITGENSSGKTNMVQNILYSLSTQQSPEAFNFYVLDFSSRILKLFRKLPHCGAVLYEDETDSFDALFKLIRSIIDERKQLFSKMEIDSFKAARSLDLSQPLPLILVVIDNLAGLGSSKTGENLLYALPGYLKGCANYGVKFVVTCGHLNEASSRIRQELPLRFCFHMKEKYDYSELLGCKVNKQPPDIPGRGLFNCDGKALEYQCVLFGGIKDDRKRIAEMKKAVECFCAHNRTNTAARQLPTTSETVTYEDFAKQFRHKCIPLGIAKQNGKPVALPFKQFSTLSLYFGNTLGEQPIIENLLFAAQRECMTLCVLKRKENSLFAGNSANPVSIGLPDNTTVFTATADDISNFLNWIVEQIEERKVLINTDCKEADPDAASPDPNPERYAHLSTETSPVNAPDFSQWQF